MSNDLWGDAGVTVVVLPSGEEGRSIYEVAKAWVDLKLLSPALWVTPELVTAHHERPPKQDVIALGMTSTGRVIEVKEELFGLLASKPINTIRLLVVRTAVQGDEYDALQDALVDNLANYMQIAMPKTEIREDGKKSAGNLVLLNLVVAPTEHHSEHAKKLTEASFNANFVAAPEDRSGPHSIDAFVRHEEGSRRFAGFALMHIASIGALWAGLPQGTYELLSSNTASMGQLAYVSRVYVSAILTDGLARRAATRVLQRAADAYSGVIDLSRNMPIDGTYEIGADQIDWVIQKLVDNTFDFDNGALSYHPPIKPERKGPGYWDHWYEQIFDFLKFAWDKLIKVPYFAGVWIWRKFVIMLNAIFQGDGSGATLTKVPEEKLDLLDRQIQEKYAGVLATKEKADQALSSPVSASQTKSTPELWTKLRTMLFGILDGSNIANFGFPKQEERVPIFHKVSSLFNDPAESLELVNPEDLSKQVKIGWRDAVASDELAKKYAELLASLAKTQASAEKELHEIEKRVTSIISGMSELQDRIEELEPSVKAGISEPQGEVQN